MAIHSGRSSTRMPRSTGRSSPTSDDRAALDQDHGVLDRAVGDRLGAPDADRQEPAARLRRQDGQRCDERPDERTGGTTGGARPGCGS